MRLVNFLFVVAALAVSATAAHIFFKAADVSPAEQQRLQLEAEITKNEGLAGQGNVQAQHRLAELYRTAPPPLQDFNKALAWYRKAADRGYAPSQYALGQMYAKGQGVRQDFYRAAEWYRLAANLARHADAQFSLGELHFHGRGVPSSYGLAIEWYTRAARQGHAVAQYFLGQINKEGWGKDVDLIEAHKWLTLANRQAGRVRAHNDLNRPEQALAELRAKMSSSQIRAAEKVLQEWDARR